MSEQKNLWTNIREIDTFLPMANTHVLISIENGLLTSSVSHVEITSSDTITFAAHKEAGGNLFFSPETAAILEPQPDAVVALEAGSSITYAFTTAEAGAYGVITSIFGTASPENFDFGQPVHPPLLILQSAQLFVEPPAPPVQSLRRAHAMPPVNPVRDIVG